MKAKAVLRRRLIRMGPKPLYHMRILVVRHILSHFCSKYRIESSMHGQLDLIVLVFAAILSSFKH